MKTWPKPESDYGTVLFSRGRGGGGGVFSTDTIFTYC